MLPPREGFSPEAVGAVGLLVHRLGSAGEVVVGQGGVGAPFSDRRFVPAEAPLWPPFGRVERYMAGVVRVVRRLAPLLIEVHNRARMALDLARACPQARVVLFVHNDPQGMRQAATPAERAVLLRRMTVVCVSKYLARRFSEGLRPEEAGPVVLANCIDFSALPALLPVEARDRTILFVGRMVADKGADAFVEACAAVLPELPGWRAEMIGADRFFPDAQATRFERALRPRAAAAGITLHGFRPHASVLDAMARAALAVVPSRWAEPFGLTALEALACGAALVCSLRGGLAEVANGVSLAADPDEPGALAATILRLARDPGLRTELAEAGHARAQKFDAPAARARLGELRARLLAT